MNNEELIFEFESGEDVVSERLELAAERIKAMQDESLSNDRFDDYFKKVSAFTNMVIDTYK